MQKNEPLNQQHIHQQVHNATQRRVDVIKSQRGLLLLRHAIACKAPDGTCSKNVQCKDAKLLLRHLSECQNTTCQVPRCSTARGLLSHFASCTLMSCELCTPVREYMKSHRTSTNSIKPHQQPPQSENQLMRDALSPNCATEVEKVKSTWKKHCEHSITPAQSILTDIKNQFDQLTQDTDSNIVEPKQLHEQAGMCTVDELRSLLEDNDDDVSQGSLPPSSSRSSGPSPHPPTPPISQALHLPEDPFYNNRSNAQGTAPMSTMLSGLESSLANSQPSVSALVSSLAFSQAPASASASTLASTLGFSQASASALSSTMGLSFSQGLASAPASSMAMPQVSAGPNRPPSSCGLWSNTSAAVVSARVREARMEAEAAARETREAAFRVSTAQAYLSSMQNEFQQQQQLQFQTQMMQSLQEGGGGGSVPGMAVGLEGGVGVTTVAGLSSTSDRGKILPPRPEAAMAAEQLVVHRRMALRCKTRERAAKQALEEAERELARARAGEAGGSGAVPSLERNGGVGEAVGGRGGGLVRDDEKRRGRDGGGLGAGTGRGGPGKGYGMGDVGEMLTGMVGGEEGRSLTEGKESDDGLERMMMSGGGKEGGLSWERHVGTLRQWLVMLKHAGSCLAGELAPCSLSPHCQEARKLLDHIATCQGSSGGSTCGSARCKVVRELMRHAGKCRRLRCVLCAPNGRVEVETGDKGPGGSGTRGGKAGVGVGTGGIGKGGGGRTGWRRRTVAPTPVLTRMTSDEISSMSGINTKGGEVGGGGGSLGLGQGLGTGGSRQNPLHQQLEQLYEQMMPAGQQPQDALQRYLATSGSGSQVDRLGGTLLEDTSALTSHLRPKGDELLWESSSARHPNLTTYPTTSNTATSIAATAASNVTTGIPPPKQWQNEDRKDPKSGDAQKRGEVPAVEASASLFLLLHARSCSRDSDPGSAGGCCPTMGAQCGMAKRHLRHVLNCEDRDCKVPHCVSTAFLLRHHSFCRDPDCKICSPVRHRIAAGFGGGKGVRHGQTGYGGGSESSTLGLKLEMSSVGGEGGGVGADQLVGDCRIDGGGGGMLAQAVGYAGGPSSNLSQGMRTMMTGTATEGTAMVPKLPTSRTNSLNSNDSSESSQSGPLSRKRKQDDSSVASLSSAREVRGAAGAAAAGEGLEVMVESADRSQEQPQSDTHPGKVQKLGPWWSGINSLVARLILEHGEWSAATSSSFRLVCKNWCKMHDSVVVSLQPRYWPFKPNESPNVRLGNSLVKPSIVTKFTGLKSLDLENCSKFVDSDIQELCVCTGLSNLRLRSCKITNRGMYFLRGLTSLTSISIDPCYQITDKGLFSLSKLPALTSVNLESSERITDIGLLTLSHIKNLKSLSITDMNKITDRGITHLSLPTSSLTALSLNKCNSVCGEGFSKLGALVPTLTSISLTECKGVTNEGITALSMFTGLTQLNLKGCDKITMDGLAPLESLMMSPYCLVEYDCDHYDIGDYLV